LALELLDGMLDGLFILLLEMILQILDCQSQWLTLK
jgi:hypothetical protein